MFKTSSLGGLNAIWLAEFYRAACGVDPISVTRRGGTGRGAVWSGSKASSQSSVLPPLTVVYPSKVTVQDSLLGEGVSKFWHDFELER